MKKSEAFPDLFEPRAVRVERAKRYYQVPIIVSQQFRDLVLAKYPNLAKGRHSEFSWRVLQHILFSEYVDSFTDEEPEESQEVNNHPIVLTHVMVAQMAGKNAYDGRFRSGPLLDDFSEHIFPLNDSDWSKLQHRARAIKPEIDESLLLLAEQELQQKTATFTQVFFHNGTLANDANIRVERKRRKHALLDTHEATPEGHPAAEIVAYLNSQSSVVLNKTVRNNWPLVLQAFEEYKGSNGRSAAEIKSVSQILGQLRQDFTAYYMAVKNSPRIYSQGLSIHNLPRELRKAALAGAVELDLKACQLAIVAAHWDVPELRDKLRSDLCNGGDIWQYLLASVGLANSAAEFKPIIKDTIYSIVFGMTHANLKRQLAHGSYVIKKHKSAAGTIRRKRGHFKNKGIGEELATQFLEQPFIQSLLAARKIQLDKIMQEKFLTDAFGQKQYTRAGFDALSVLAYVAQSYELWIMQALFEVVRDNKQIYILSWLHDGVTLQFGNSSKRDAEIKAIQKAVDKRCQAARKAVPGGEKSESAPIPTRLEVTPLLVPILTIASEAPDSEP